MDLQDKRIILTGTSSGIGQALLALLLKKGAKILAVDLEASTTQLSSGRCLYSKWH